MSRAYDHIKDLNPKKEVWKLAVRIDDIWTNTHSSKESAKMIIRDIQGDSIHAVFGPGSHIATSATGSHMTLEDSFIQTYRILKLSDIMKLPKDEICVTVVKTLHVCPSDRGWYMLGCQSCIKETKGTEPPYECGDHHKTTNPILRFRLDVQVGHGDADTKFVFWDNTCIDLLGVTASELQKTMVDDVVTDPLEYPKSFFPLNFSISYLPTLTVPLVEVIIFDKNNSKVLPPYNFTIGSDTNCWSRSGILPSNNDMKYSPH